MTLESPLEHSADHVDWSTRRADARRNHERILTAAIELFAEKGVSATIPQIAKRAGVGKATVYRSYPTKEDLVAAVAAFQIEWLRNYIEQTSNNDDDPYTTLRTTLHIIVDRLALDRSLAEALPESSYDNAPFEGMISACQRQGTVRPDVTGYDVRVLLGGVSRVLFGQQEHDPEKWHRYADLILNALSTHPSDKAHD